MERSSLFSFKTFGFHPPTNPADSYEIRPHFILQIKLNVENIIYSSIATTEITFDFGTSEKVSV